MTTQKGSFVIDLMLMLSKHCQRFAIFYSIIIISIGISGT
jgi:hypothetical protein